MRSPVAFIVLALSSVAVAQDPTQPAPQAEATGSWGIDFTNQYFFRGIAQENQGVIAQPWYQLGYSLHDGGETVKSLGLTVGLWNSLHDGPTGGAGGPWYESDFYVGLSAAVGERLTIGTTYTAYYSPNGSFGTVEELAFSFGLDDRGLLTDAVESGLRPSLVLAVETDGQADAGNHVGIYAQFGIEPLFALGQFGSLDATLAVPVTLGTSLSDYYEDPSAGGDDEFFGFLDIGAVVSSPLPFMPSRLGPWTGELGLHWLLLGDNNEERNVGDSAELIVSFGLATAF
ncbi:MAG: hypothetical protein JNK15_01740 [Planctomycetes bacterium]|nr:hypothetical protein [Planctomycetota bacterium]